MSDHYLPQITWSWLKAKLGQVGLGLNIAQNHFSSPGSHSWSLFDPIHMQSWPKVNLGQAGVGSNSAQNHSSSPRKSYLVIICPNSHEKLTKSEIKSSWSRFKHCSKLLDVWPVGNHIWPLLAPITWKCDRIWSYVKLLFAPIWFYLPLFGPKIPFLSILSLTYLHLPLCICVCHNVALITLIWSYLPLIALIYLPCVPHSPGICVVSSIETAPVWKRLEQSTIIHGYIAFYWIGGYGKCL